MNAARAMADTVQAAPRYSRKEALEKWGGAYALAHDAPTGCVYCGIQDGCGKDHVPPLSFVSLVGKPEGLCLYDACPVCNGLLSKYPVTCLKDRAEYLICVLRREWALLVSGQPRRWDRELVAASGQNIKRRLASGEVAALCRCSGCRVR